MKYLLIHTHNFGVTCATFIAKGFNPEELSITQLIKLASKCNLSYEYDQDEGLTVVPLNEKVIKVSKEDIK